MVNIVRWCERHTRTLNHKNRSHPSGFSISKQTQYLLFPIRDFYLYLKHIFLHRKSIKPNLNAIENEIITPITFRFMFKQCTNLKF